ncbi:hypothetical protein JCM14469_35980 [Desulfatiferula olefinivorans]
MVSLGCVGAVIPAAAQAALKRAAVGRVSAEHDAHIKDYLHKIEHFDDSHPGDLYLDETNLDLLHGCLARLTRVEQTVGHGLFALIGIDQAIRTARMYPSIGAFTRRELDFLEMIFYRDGAQYGFLGEKPLSRFTDTLKTGQLVKIRNTGNYLYKGRPLHTYRIIRKALGDDLVLTSGLRSVTKQFMLFLGKTARSGGNLSQASRSLAPPGYSFHGVGDFDVGQRGYGSDNFTWRFTQSPVYRKLTDLGYIRLRYTEKNALGVRFEPWHIKVV